MKNRRESLMKRRNFSAKGHKGQWASVLKEGKWRYDVQMAQYFPCCIHAVAFNSRCIHSEEDLHQEETRCDLIVPLINTMKRYVTFK